MQDVDRLEIELYAEVSSKKTLGTTIDRFKNKYQIGKITQPISSLPSWQVIATIFSYYGWSSQVIDLLQIISTKTRKYVKSHHNITLCSFLREHRWHPHHEVPLTINAS